MDAPKGLKEAYEGFFLKNESGKYFIQIAQATMSQNHLQAESNPELSRDLAQRAAGIRELLVHIQTVLTPAKKGAPKE